MDLRELVGRIARDRGWGVREDDGALQLEVPLDRGRSQRVSVSGFQDGGGDRVRFTTRIGSVAGLGEGRFRGALEINMRIPHGCLAVDGEYMVLTETCPLDAATPGISGEAVVFLAQQADAYERFIFGTDTH